MNKLYSCVINYDKFKLFYSCSFELLQEICLVIFVYLTQ